MSIANRLKKLEQIRGAASQGACIAVVRGNTDAETESNRAEAQAAYKATHPDWKPSRYDFYLIVDSECKEMLEHIADRL